MCQNPASNCTASDRGLGETPALVLSAKLNFRDRAGSESSSPDLGDCWPCFSSQSGRTATRLSVFVPIHPILAANVFLRHATQHKKDEKGRQWSGGVEPGATVRSMRGAAVAPSRTCERRGRQSRVSMPRGNANLWMSRLVRFRASTGSFGLLDSRSSKS